MGKRDHEVVSTESMVDRSFHTAHLIIDTSDAGNYYIFVMLFLLVVF